MDKLTNPNTTASKLRRVEAKQRPEPDAARRNERSHQAVLDAAQALLAETGYSSVTIDQISARAGVGKATVYRWWPNKAAIFMELYHDLADKAIRPRDTGSLRTDLQLVLRGAFKMLRTTVAGLALAGFVAEGQAHPEVGRLLRDEFAKNRRLINLAILERAVERSEIPANAPLELVSDMITGAVYYGILIGDVAASERRADQILEMILGGLAAFASQPVSVTGGAQPATRPVTALLKASGNAASVCFAAATRVSRGNPNSAIHPHHQGDVL